MKDKKQKKAKKSGKGAGAKASKGLKSLAKNPLLADVVAAALVATASALKDPKRARALASDAGDELAKLSKAGSERGSALWDMAIQIGRRSLESLSGKGARKPAKTKPAKTKPAKTKPAKTKSATKTESAAKTKSAARKPSKKQQASAASAE